MCATAETVEEIGEKFNNDCNMISDWMEMNSFKLNAGKTHLLTMGTAKRLNNLDDQLSVVMDGVTLQENQDRCELLLGVYIQSDLKWSKQTSELTGKLKKRLAGLKRLRFIMDFSTRKNIV